MFVCIAPLVATIQISELFTTTLGAEAVGTDLSITVELTVFVSAPNAEFIMLFKKNINIVANTVPIINGFFIHYNLSISVFTAVHVNSE